MFSADLTHREHISPKTMAKTVLILASQGGPPSFRKRLFHCLDIPSGKQEPEVDDGIATWKAQVLDDL